MPTIFQRQFFDENILPILRSNNSQVFDGISLVDGVYIYGAGELGRLALEYCESRKIPVLAFLDRNTTNPVYSNHGTEYRCFLPSDQSNAINKSRLVLVAISSVPYTPIKEYLVNNQWKNIQPFYNLCQEHCEEHPLANGWFLGKVTPEEIEMSRSVCARFADSQSLVHYVNFLSWHRDNSEQWLSHIRLVVNARYVIDEVINALRGRTRQFIDVGAHKGESYDRLLKAELTFDTYDFFEPDQNSCESLRTLCKKLNEDGHTARLHNYALANRKETTRFQPGLGYCSQIWSFGSQVVETKTIDDFGFLPDYLKIHTEGAERSILVGASNTIKSANPIFAFSVYHKREGFTNDILVPMISFPNYRWYFRMHGFQGAGAFVYAIPDKDSTL